MPKMKRILSAIVLSFVVVQGWQMPAAQADDSRSVNALGEIIAYYQHFLGRKPDPTGLKDYLNGAHRDCREGVTEAARSIANSDEAHAYLNTNARLAGSIYSGFLNRVPDEKGWKDQKAALDASTSWAEVTENVLSEPEFQARLDRVCEDAVANETAICEAVGVGDNGPPSASIPPDLQPFFNCYSAGSGSYPRFPLTVECMLSSADSIWEIGGAVTSAAALRSKAKTGAKIIIKKIGVVGLVFTGNDLIGAWQDCT